MCKRKDSRLREICFHGRERRQREGGGPGSHGVRWRTRHARSDAAVLVSWAVRANDQVPVGQGCSADARRWCWREGGDAGPSRQVRRMEATLVGNTISTGCTASRAGGGEIRRGDRSVWLRCER